MLKETGHFAVRQRNLTGAIRVDQLSAQDLPELALGQLPLGLFRFFFRFQYLL
jgi:hypothetical protein